MYRELDMTGPGAWRRALAAAAVIGSVVVLAGCSSGPDPKAQREEIVAETQAVMEGVMFNAKTPEATVLDDATKPIDCPSGGSQFRYIAYRATDWYAGMPDVNQRFYLLKTMLLGASAEGFHHTRFVEVVPEGGGEVPRQTVFFVDKGTRAGSSLTVDMIPGAGGVILVRFAGATACG